MDNKNDEVLKYIVEHYGEHNQFSQAQEECAELIVAVSKYNRDPSIFTRNSIVEEIADVEIMIRQLKMILNISPVEIASMINKKLTRQVERIESQKK